MPSVRPDLPRPRPRRPDTGRRSGVPRPFPGRTLPSVTAGRSVWVAALWTGAGTAVIGAAVAITGVAITWLPGSHGTGNAASAIKAGLLTFLAALHGGITVDGTPATFLPLGLLLILGAIAWRAGAGLADAVGEEGDRRQLLLIGATQSASFTLTCLLFVPLAALGTSSAPFAAVGFSALVVFTVTGGVAFAWNTPLRGAVSARVPAFVGTGARIAAAALGVYLVAGSLLVAVSLFLHLDRASDILREVGPGWNGAPITLLCLLAAPNAVIAGAAYLAGPGFAVGSGTTVGIGSTATGVLPAFPVLAAVPSGPSPDWMWAFVAGVPLAAGLLAGAMAGRAPGWPERLRDAGTAAGLAGVGGAVLAWQGGGGIGERRLATVGASPWQFGGAVALEVAAGALVYLALHAAWGAVRGRSTTTPVIWAATPDAVTERIEVVDEQSGEHAGTPTDELAEAKSRRRLAG